MEDAHTCYVSLNDQLSQWSFFAVFDGHAGKIAAEICSKDLVEEIRKTLLNDDTLNALTDSGGYDVSAVKETIKKSFLKMDVFLREKLKERNDRSGTTCTALLVAPNHYFFINCGDSRGMLTKSNESVSFSTTDHKPTNDAERERIVKAGGLVMTQRINGSLAVSRALGDFDYKQDMERKATEQLVSPEPDVHEVARDAARDQFICLACDGIFDVFSNEELSNYITSRLKVSQKYDMITAEIVDTSLHKGSKDNMSVILIALPACVKEDPSAKEAESKLNQLLKEETEKYINEYGREHDMHVMDVCNHLTLNEEISRRLAEVAPGGGIHAKHSFVESVITSLKPGNDQDE